MVVLISRVAVSEERCETHRAQARWFPVGGLFRHRSGVFLPPRYHASKNHTVYCMETPVSTGAMI